MSAAIETTDIEFQVVILMYFGYVIIFLASSFGNTLVIHIIRTDRSMKTTTNHLILNQACADILITVIYLLNTVHISYQRLWFGGLIGLITCKLFLSSFPVVQIFSVWLLVAIAVDRFYAVTRPLRRSLISRNLKKVILVLWMWCIACSLNIFVNVQIDKVKESFYCEPVIQLRKDSELNTFSMVSNIVLPLLVIIILYTIICIKLWSRKVPGEGGSQNQRQAEALETARKVTRMMIAVVILFLLCWLPLFISNVLQLFGFVHYTAILFPAWLAVAYSGLNPYVYFTFSANFRNAVKRLFGNIRVLPFRSQSVELQQL